MHASEAVAVLLFILLVVAVYVAAAVVLIRPRLARRRVKVAVLSLAGAGTLCILYGLLIEPGWVETTHTTVETADWPGGTRLRIALISDLHLDGLDPHGLPARIAAENPDLILIAGTCSTRPTRPPRCTRWRWS